MERSTSRTSTTKDESDMRDEKRDYTTIRKGFQ